MPYLQGLERTWETLAQADPMWAICTDPARAGRRWELSEFMATGETEIYTVMNRIRDLGVRLDFSGAALDFGCGVGRLTQPLAKRFKNCTGIDISATMIETARTLSSGFGNCQFRVNRAASLQMFEAESFSFVYSNIVLQHIAPRYAKRYIQEFIRVLRPGGALVFQTADSIRGRFLERLSARTRIRTRLKALFRPAPMAMYFLPETKVRKLLAGLRIVEVSLTNACQSDYDGCLTFLQREPEKGSISKFYVVVKEDRKF
jgi:2-polyprenyl-3-methyl-5-hydroxy-6-metoxy-1,4-benzoquinol methylase